MKEHQLQEVSTMDEFWQHANPRALRREIEDRAYALYEWRIYHDEAGDSDSDWSQAEDEIRMEHGFSPRHPMSGFTSVQEPE
jgi:hypothetical protein